VLTRRHELEVTADRLDAQLKKYWMFLTYDDKLKIKQIKWLLLSIVKRIREGADTVDTTVTGADNE